MAKGPLHSIAYKMRLSASGASDGSVAQQTMQDLMHMEHWWEDADRWEPNCSQETLS
jgi:hypothetical protein